MKKIIFLGTPLVAAHTLACLHRECFSFLEIALVVSQPAKKSLRGSGLIPTPVQEMAQKLGLPVLCPESVKDPVFLEQLSSLKPDLCLTAAYGNYLPKSFLDIPVFGTVNIHPSSLPRYRGASPVQRAMENGDTKFGVSLLFSVAKMDAGPILAQKEFILEQDIQSPQALLFLFEEGAKMLVSLLPAVFQGTASLTQQKEEWATYAPKLSTEESRLNFSLPAICLHNKVRAFSGWPGTKASFVIQDSPQEIKILKTKIPSVSAQVPNPNLKPGEVSVGKESIYIGCGENTVLSLLELQLPGKKPLLARDFLNGLKSQRFYLVH